MLLSATSPRSRSGSVSAPRQRLDSPQAPRINLYVGILAHKAGFGSRVSGNPAPACGSPAARAPKAAHALRPKQCLACVSW